MTSQRTTRDIMLLIARIAVPVIYAAGYYACALYLPTYLAVITMTLLVLLSCAWFFACMRANDPKRSSNLALHGFITKVLTLPIEVICIMVYVGVAMSSGISYSVQTWVLSVATMYLGVIGSSLFVIGAAREACQEGLISAGWRRAFSICALIPACDILAGIFLWFWLLRQRLFA